MILANQIKIVQTLSFKKSVKKLHNNQKADLDKAVKTLMLDPLLGCQKVILSYL